MRPWKTFTYDNFCNDETKLIIKAIIYPFWSRRQCVKWDDLSFWTSILFWTSSSYFNSSGSHLFYISHSCFSSSTYVQAQNLVPSLFVTHDWSPSQEIISDQYGFHLLKQFLWLTDRTMEEMKNGLRLKTNSRFSGEWSKSIIPQNSTSFSCWWKYITSINNLCTDDADNASLRDFFIPLFNLNDILLGTSNFGFISYFRPSTDWWSSSHRMKCSVSPTHLGQTP